VRGTVTPMEAALRAQVLRAGAIEIRPAEFLALVDGRPLNLTARELDLLTALVLRQGRIVSREELYAAVWEEPYRKSDRSVDVYVAKLRQKLDDALPATRFIHTHFGFGYRLEQERAVDGDDEPRLPLGNRSSRGSPSPSTAAGAAAPPSLASIDQPLSSGRPRA
jgi:DNA-binding winged helix-turn-helix (wHTH) protein